MSDQTIAATEQSSEERRDAEAVMGTETVETFSTEKAGWFCMQTLWRRRKIVCELCGGSHGKPCSICHGKGVITDDCILLSWSEEMYGMWRKREKCERRDQK